MPTEQGVAEDVNMLLVSAPWGSPVRPSIQLGTLKAYVDRHPALSHVRTRILSAHFGVLAEACAGDFPELYRCAESFGESIYQLLYLKEFGLPGTPFDPDLFESCINDLANEEYDAVAIRRAIELIEAGSKDYMRRRIVRRLSRRKTNVVGFTLNFNQVYSSLFMLKLIAKYAPWADATFLLGGHSVAIPRVRQQIERMGISAYYILGEGETKLAGFLSALGISRRPDVPGVFHSSTGAVIDHRADKASQIGHLGELPPPCYDDYFEELRHYCASEEAFIRLKDIAVVMMEGSRGCFAKCDFCGFNVNWNGFRKLEAEAIADTAEYLAAKYRCRSVFYVDNVCDTWAEGFSRIMLSKKTQLKGYMELRAHHPERFWTGLKLAGVETIQVGVEALSAPLIRKMRKGTTLVQNLRAQKYISELNIGSGANIITHHPKSTLQDVEDTKSLLEMIPHFQPFNLAHFAVSIGSPIYEELSAEDKGIVNGSLSVNRFRNVMHGHELDWRHELPPALRLAADVEKAWDEFETWFRCFDAENESRGPQMTCWRVGSAVQILDLRCEAPREHVLEGVKAELFDICHAGLPAPTIANEIDCREDAIVKLLEELCADKLLVETEGQFLSLALRPEETLVSNYYEPPGICRDREARGELRRRTERRETSLPRRADGG